MRRASPLLYLADNWVARQRAIEFGEETDGIDSAPSPGWVVVGATCEAEVAVKARFPTSFRWRRPSSFAPAPKSGIARQWKWSNQLARSRARGAAQTDARSGAMGIEPAWPAWKIGHRSRGWPVLMLTCGYSAMGDVRDRC